ncbi:MAG: isochorismate synthase MenF [Xenococcaceae cyanobacterium]
MQFITHPESVFEERQSLHHFLKDCQQTLNGKCQTKIVSISFEIAPVDPLAVLHEMAVPNQLSFYFEKRCQGEAIAAFNGAISLKIEEPQRFSRAQNFIRNCQNNIITAGDLHLPFAGPRFFCSFTFFDKHSSENSPFPPATVFLPRWQVARCQNSCVLVANTIINYNDNIEILSHSIWQTFQQINSVKYRPIELTGNNGQVHINQYITSPEDFKKGVISALKSIAANHFRKIVIADAIDVSSPNPFQIIPSLNNLRQIYPDCYIFAISNGRGTNFIGASPEQLISIRDHQLVTDALAGSAPRGKTLAEDADFANALLCSDKERHEQRVVIDFISDRLRNLGLTPQVSPQVRLLQLSNIQHLCTSIQAEVPAHIHALDIVAQLHPTPAVAGVPIEVACKQIRRYETFDRTLYAAPLGWVDYQGNSEFIVGIRSALIAGNHGRLYAGAGIVAGSHPERELAEVQLKLKAMFNALV